MKNNFDAALLRFQLKTLFTDKTALVQMLILHWWLGGFVFEKKGLAAGVPVDALLWTNYGLLVALCAALLLGSVAAGFTLIKPRAYGMLELLLASPLSLRRLAATSFATCLGFSLLNLAVHFALLKLRFGVAPSGAGFWFALAAAGALTAFAVLGAVVLSLRRKDADQLQAAMVLVGMVIFAALFFLGIRHPVPGWLPPALAAAAAAGFALLWSRFDRLLDKERTVRL